MAKLLLLEHPIVLAAAEELARDAYNAMRDLPPERGHLPMAQWETLRGGGYCNIRIEAQAHLLCDLSRPTARDWWVRWGRAHLPSGLNAFDTMAMRLAWSNAKDEPHALAQYVVATLVDPKVTL